MGDMITIDGSVGEGGGQILRTSLALSLITQTPVRLINIRAGRSKPGLRPQHVTSVTAAASIGMADVSGNVVGSRELAFRPNTIQPGDYIFSTGTAGSCSLVLQTILLPLVTAGGPSRLVLEGGTHNPFAPPYDFLEKTFLPILCRMGPAIAIRLIRPGFFPAGGGRMEIGISRGGNLNRIELTERGRILRIAARAIIARLPRHIAERELAVVETTLPTPLHASAIEEIPLSRGPGNAVIIEIGSEQITELFTAFGRRGIPAEDVAMDAVNQANAYLAASAPVGPHLADQLLLPMALAGGGEFRTVAPTRHFTTNSEIIKRFMPVEFAITQISSTDWQVIVESAR
jgi:RNA 3'-terminal phosphate cyclase (ATP)